MNKKAIIVLSGGMDSSTLAYEVKEQGYDLLCVSFNYGQRHNKELQYAAGIAEALGAEHLIIDLSDAGSHLTGSSLTDDIDVPDGHYSEETMRITVVPNRNAIMLSIAWGIAVSENAVMVATAVHAGDHFIYPDCRPEFIEALNTALRLATVGHRHEDLHIYAPYLDYSKDDIGQRGHNKFNVPYDKTWTCYKGGDIHCGTCGACVERKEALHGFDTTEYLA